MSLIESRDILNKLCSNDYYRGDDVQCAIQCLAEGKTINRVRTLEDVGQTVIDEELKDRLMKLKGRGNAFDDVNWAWLLPLFALLLMPERNPRDSCAIFSKRGMAERTDAGTRQNSPVASTGADAGTYAYPAYNNELRKAAEPLHDYLLKCGDPHTCVVVTQRGATLKRDESGVAFVKGADERGEAFERELQALTGNG